MQTIADDLLLLLLDDTGKPRIDRTKMDYALAGAVLIELALDHRIDVVAGPRRASTVVVTDARPSRTKSLTAPCARSMRDAGAPTGWCRS